MMAESDMQKYQETANCLKMPYQMLAIMKQCHSFHYQNLINRIFIYFMWADTLDFSKIHHFLPTFQL
jgi:hypothetical protein